MQDYYKTFRSDFKLISARIIFAFRAVEDLELYQIDDVSLFDIEAIYVETYM